MLLALCLALSGKPSRKAPPRRPGFRRPLLEALEERTVLSAFQVITTADNGDNTNPIAGSLREAINKVNAGLYSEIDFAITASDTGGGYNSATGVATIAPPVALPAIYNPVLINGYTQAGASPNMHAMTDPDPSDNAALKIVLDGHLLGTGAYGLYLDASNSTVQGLVINKFNGAGIWANGSGDVIRGNFLGIDVSGTVAAGNAGADVALTGSGNTVGGPSPADRNVISGNNFSGSLSEIYGFVPNGSAGVYDNGSNGQIEGNFIGSDATGKQAVPNYWGVTVVGDGSTIGGTPPGTGNLISGNSDAGIAVYGGSSVTIQGNQVGTDVTGTAALSDGKGVYVVGLNAGQSGGTGVTIGGATASAGNLVSGNAQYGIFLEYGSNSAIEGNRIGTDANGNPVLGNGYGVRLEFDSHDNTVSGNTIADNYAGVFLYIGPSGNSITGNTINANVQGILVQGASNDRITANTLTNSSFDVVNLSGAPNGGNYYPAAGDTISQNAIYNNSDREGRSIELNLGIAQVGNDGQLAPVLTAASASAAGTTVTGTLAGAANTTYRIEFFSNPALDQGANFQGQTYLGFATVATDSGGYIVSSPDGSAVITNPGTANASYTATRLVPVPAGQAVLSATATNLSTGDTSEFSPEGVIAVAALTSSANPSIPGQPVTLAATLSAYAAGFGTPAGSVDFVNTTTGTDLGAVALSGGSAALTTSALAVGTHVIQAVYGGGTFLGTSATLTQVVTQSIYVLNKTEGGALSISGHASINIPGTLVVDSNSKHALTASGHAQVTAASIRVVGGVDLDGQATLSPAPVMGVGAVPDPLAGLVAPTGGTAQGSVSLNKGSLTINPGVYQSIKVSGSASLTLNPGVYVIAGGGLTVTGNASLNGSGVVLYNAGGDFCHADDRGGITLSGNGTFRLSAPAGGPYAGVVIFQARDNTRALSLSRNAVAGLGGTLYAPAALLYLGGDAALQGALVVNELTLTGDSASSQAADGSDVSAGATAGQLLAGDVAVYVNDPAGLFTIDQLARIKDAVSAVDAVVEPYGVSVSETSDPSAANVVIDTGSSSAVGGYADGILGCYSTTGEVTLIQGWNWYAGSDPTQIGARQYDFQTTVTHELGHALGLGEGDDPTSVMYGTLAAGAVHRALTTADLNIPYDGGGSDAQRAAVPATSPETSSTAAPSSAVGDNIRVVPVSPAGMSPDTSRAAPVVTPAVPNLVEVIGPGSGGRASSDRTTSRATTPVSPAIAPPAARVSVPTSALAIVPAGAQPRAAGASDTEADPAAVPPAAPEPSPGARPPVAPAPLPEPAGPTEAAPSSADLPGVPSQAQVDPRAAAADAFFQAVSQGLDQASGPGAKAVQAVGPAPGHLTAASALLPVLGAVWGALAEDSEPRKHRSRQR
jgi:parallel beta-helix repeat protein